jgi:hypothetical protein
MPTRGSIAEIELTHPVVGSTAAADNDQKNKELVSHAEYSWKEFHFIVQYRVNVKDGEKNESRLHAGRLALSPVRLTFALPVRSVQTRKGFCALRHTRCTWRTPSPSLSAASSLTSTISILLVGLP